MARVVAVAAANQSPDGVMVVRARLLFSLVAIMFDADAFANPADASAKAADGFANMEDAIPNVAGDFAAPTPG